MKTHSCARLLLGIVLTVMLIIGLGGAQVFAETPDPEQELIGIPHMSSFKPTPQQGVTAGWEWVEGSIWYTSIIDWTGSPATGFGTYVSYYQNAGIGQPAVGTVYYVGVTVYGISSPQAGTMSAYITFVLPPSTSLAISAATPMICYGGSIPFVRFTCDFTLQQVVPGQYAIPSGEYGNVWSIAAGAGWEFLIPVTTSTTLNNSNFQAEITNIDAYQNPPKLYPYVPIYVWPTSGTLPGAFTKALPVNEATGVPTTNTTLYWYASEGATTYMYCYNTTNTCTTWIEDNNTALPELSPGTKYYWHVKAVNNYGETYSDGSPLAFWSFTTASSGSSPGVFNKSGPANGATGVFTSPTLSWTTSSGVNSYEYCYDTSNNNDCAAWFNNGTTTSVGLSGLSANTTYYWHVRAVNGGGTTYSDGSSTAFWSFKTAGAASPPGDFIKSSPSNGATGLSTSPTLTWEASNGVTSYEYCYDTTNDNACSTWVDNGTATSTALSGLTANTTYFWHVLAANSNGTTYSDGSSTAFWSFRTAAPGEIKQLYLPLILNK